MGETEIRTADAAEGTVVASTQSAPQPKSASKATSGNRKSAKASGGSARQQDERAAVRQGRPGTVWDKTQTPPDERLSIAEDPDGTKNAKQGK